MTHPISQVLISLGAVAVALGGSLHATASFGQEADVTNTGSSSVMLEPVFPRHLKIDTIEIVGRPEIVFDHKDQAEAYNFPDAQITAWKDANGTVSLMVPMTEAYRMTGPNLHQLVLDRHKVFSSSLQAEQIPEDLYNFDHWFVAPYTLDGKTIFTLAHSEWYGCLLVDCSNSYNQGYEGNSWVTTINSFISNNGGAHFAIDGVAEEHVVANLGYHWTGSEALDQRVYHNFYDATGVPILSRVIREGDFFYAIGFLIQRDFSNLTTIETEQAPTTKNGLIIIRTNDVRNPLGWQAWVQGSTFAPIRGGQLNTFWPELNGAPFNNVALGQVIFDLRSNLYILILAPFGTPGAVAYTTSPSLAHPSWSPIQFIIGSDAFRTDPRSAQQPCNTGFDDSSYVSLLDANSPGLNFEYTNGALELFYVVNPSVCGGDNLARDIYRASLKITYQPDPHPLR